MLFEHIHDRRDLSAGAVIFDTVAVNIEKYLPQMDGAAVNIRVRDHGLTLFIVPFDARLHRAADDDADDILRQVDQADELVRQHGFSVLELAHLQNVVDEREQMICRDGHFLVVLAHERGIVKVRLVDLQKADDAVERRSDVVAHATLEVCLSLVGAVRFRRGLLEIFLVFELFRLLLVDVAGGNEKMRYIAVFVAVFRNQRDKVPGAVLPLELAGDEALFAQALRRRRKIQKYRGFLMLRGRNDLIQDTKLRNSPLGPVLP